MLSYAFRNGLTNIAIIFSHKQHAMPKCGKLGTYSTEFNEPCIKQFIISITNQQACYSMKENSPFYAGHFKCNDMIHNVNNQSRGLSSGNSVVRMHWVVILQFLRSELMFVKDQMSSLPTVVIVKWIGIDIVIYHPQLSHSRNQLHDILKGSVVPNKACICFLSPTLHLFPFLVTRSYISSSS